MEKKVYAFYYEEILESGEFSPDLLPFTQHPIALEFRPVNLRSFRESGGLRVVDYYTATHIHVRATYWNSESGYEKWKTNPELKKYIELRTDYNSSNNIKDQIRGPVEVTENE